jgi:hypothetical protein
MTDIMLVPVWMALVAIGHLIVTAVIAAWNKHQDKIDAAELRLRLKEDARGAADKISEKVVEVKKDLQKTTTSTSEQLDTIHSLVNGHMKAALRVTMLATARTAELSSDPAGAKIAAEARRAYEEHVKSMGETTC